MAPFQIILGMARSCARSGCLQSLRRVICRAKAMNETHLAHSGASSRQAVDALAGATLLEFGTSWCGHCRAAQPLIAKALAAHPGVRHVKIEDGSGLPLGRSFGVKLWPTLVFLGDGRELARLVRPRDAGAIERALALIARPA
jgi:thioredoxin 1